MIAGCPKCAARYRIDPAKLRPEGARLRCSRCETVFRVQPDAGEAAAAPAVSRAPAEPPRAAPVARPMPKAGESQRAAASAQPTGDPAKRVLIAHPEVAAGKRIADAVASWGLSPLLVHDGVEAMLQIQRTLPRVVVLDAALPKMFGFQICEVMKRNEQLRVIPVVLCGAIHDQDRYRRPPPEDLYGADAYVERQQLPDALVDLLARFGIQSAAAAPQSAASAAPASIARPAPPAPAATPAPARPVRPEPPAPARAAAPPAAPAAAPAVGAPAANPEIEKAQRLARIIVSDVILYNPEKFEAAVRAGEVVNALSAELEEGYALFASRVDTRVCDPREYLQRELVRVARSRGMK
jgi:predicted Zn finger-like uncharacterized protein